jgi:phytoene/squalene synthetase
VTDDGLSPQTRAWLAGAGNRLSEPVREDRPEDVKARLDQHSGAAAARATCAAQLRALLAAAQPHKHAGRWYVPRDELRALLVEWDKAR